MSDVVIRRPRRGEGPELAALYQQSFHRYSRRDVAHDLHRLTSDIVVAAVGGRVVGLGCWDTYVRVNPRGELPGLLADVGPEVRDLLPVEPVVRPGDVVFSALAVHPGFRRRGIASRLVLARMRLATDQGASQVFVHCVDGAGSRELYLKLGFTELLTRDGFYADGAAMHLLFCAL